MWLRIVATLSVGRTISIIEMLLYCSYIAFNGWFLAVLEDTTSLTRKVMPVLRAFWWSYTWLTVRDVNNYSNLPLAWRILWCKSGSLSVFPIFSPDETDLSIYCNLSYVLITALWEKAMFSA